MSDKLDGPVMNSANLVHFKDEALMRLQADISDELERRYREAKREQNARADELRRQSSHDSESKR